MSDEFVYFFPSWCSACVLSVSCIYGWVGHDSPQLLAFQRFWATFMFGWFAVACVYVAA